MDEHILKINAKLKVETMRDDFELRQQQYLQMLEGERESKKQIHSIYVDAIQNGLSYLMEKREALVMVTQYVLGISVGFYLSKYGLSTLFTQVESRLRKPRLVRETSRWTLNLSSQNVKQREKDIFTKVVFNPELEFQLKLISNGYISKKSKSKPLRNFLFYGPPGVSSHFAKMLLDREDLICEVAGLSLRSALRPHLGRRYRAAGRECRSGNR